MQMKHYRLDGNYGTFAITRTVLAVDEQAAFEQTGIMATLVDAGWEVAEAPDGEEWEITEIEMPDALMVGDKVQFVNCPFSDDARRASGRTAMLRGVIKKVRTGADEGYDVTVDHHVGTIWFAKNEVERDDNAN